MPRQYSLTSRFFKDQRHAGGVEVSSMDVFIFKKSCCSDLDSTLLFVYTESVLLCEAGGQQEVGGVPVGR